MLCAQPWLCCTHQLSAQQKVPSQILGAQQLLKVTLQIFLPCWKPARHKGQLLSATQMRQKRWACPSALFPTWVSLWLPAEGAGSSQCRAVLLLQSSCSAANPCTQQPSLKRGISYYPAAGSQSFWLKRSIWEGGICELDAKLMGQFNSLMHLLVCKEPPWSLWFVLMFHALALRKQRAERLDESRVRKLTESSNYLTKPSNTHQHSENFIT